jgi:hypothetical protein
MTTDRGASRALPMPVAGEPPRPNVPVPSRLTLSNGLRLVAVPWGTLPQAVLRLVVPAGSTSDPADRPGLANLAGQLLIEGTERRDAAALNEQLDRLGRLGRPAPARAGPRAPPSRSTVDDLARTSVELPSGRSVLRLDDHDLRRAPRPPPVGGPGHGTTARARPARRRRGGGTPIWTTPGGDGWPRRAAGGATKAWSRAGSPCATCSSGRPSRRPSPEPPSSRPTTGCTPSPSPACSPPVPNTSSC